MDYLKVQERVYEQLAEWRETYGWDFSLRKQGRKGARTNRFIGKETGGYFGTTFWDSDIRYGGAPVGFVTLLFRLKGGHINYEFEIRQSDSAEGIQNELAADFLRQLQGGNSMIGPAEATNQPDASIMYSTIGSKRSFYSSLTDLLEDLKFQLKDFISNFDTELQLFKEKHPDFTMRRLDEKDTKQYEESYRRRLERYADTTESDETTAELSVEQWLEFLRDPEVFTPKELAIINAFYHSPNHTNTTTRVYSIIYQRPFEISEPGPINKLIYELTRRIEPKLSQPFSYRIRDNGKPAYYSMLFTAKRVEPYWEWRMHPNLVEAYRRFGPAEAPDFKEVFENRVMNNYLLNQILYGPPGTGKTYATIEMAVRIANPDFTNFGDREALHGEFRRLKEVRRIAFTTFHQSLSYEDFVEGLKPKLEEGEETDIAYEIKPGIFRLSAAKAKLAAARKNINQKTADSLSFLHRYDSFMLEVEDQLDGVEKEYALKTKTNKEVNIVGVNTAGDVRIKHGEHDRTHLVRRNKVREYNSAYLEYQDHSKAWGSLEKKSNHTAVWAVWNAVTNFAKAAPDSDVINLSEFESSADADPVGLAATLNDVDFTHAPAHVLIIDEINRGNVSAILGELITLLEPDKRLGAAEELKVTLPYSREEFGVPPNLYIIGTMNTADRSVEALDAALRRRFTFREVAPDPSVITNRKEGDQGMISVDELKVDLAELLTLLNHRIKALKDADHLIGHSYFLKVKDAKGLTSAFNDRIIPLLREYFFANYGQLQLVVGKGFCAVDPANTTTFADADEEVDDYAGDYKSYHFPAPATEVELATALRQLGLS